MLYTATTNAFCPKQVCGDLEMIQSHGLLKRCHIWNYNCKSAACNMNCTQSFKFQILCKTKQSFTSLPHYYPLKDSIA